MKKKAIVPVIYILCLFALLYHFNSKRPEEYTYQADLAGYDVEAGMLADPGPSLYIDESFGYSGEFAFSPGMQLRPGDYDITISYSATGDNTMHLSADANFEEYVDLPASQTFVNTKAYIYPSSDEFRIWLIYKGAGSLRIDSVVISSAQPLYTDYEYYMVLTVLLGFLVPVLIMYLAKKKRYTRTDWIEKGILVLLIVLVNYPLFFGRLWIGVDMRGQLMRVAGVSKSLEAGRFPSILFSNFCNGYGELSCIYPHVFLYIPGFLRKCGVSFLSSYATIHVIVNAGTLVIMYYCARYLTGRRIPSFIAAVMYCFIPYRLCVMGYNSMTLGSGLGMMFMPVVFTGLYDTFFKKGKRWYLLAIGMAGLAYCHVLSSALALVMCIVTAVLSFLVLYFLKAEKADVLKVIKHLVLSASVFFAICLWIIVPFVYYYSKGLNISTMSIDFMESLENFEGGHMIENGLFHLMVLAASLGMIVLLRKKKYSFKEPYPMFALYMTVTGLGLFWMSTVLFPWGPFTKIGFIYDKLCMLQFPERFMLVGNAAVCLGFGMLCEPFIKHTGMNKAVKWAGIAVLAATVVMGCSESRRVFTECDELFTDRMSGNYIYYVLDYLPPGSEESFYESRMPDIGDWDSVENIAFTKVGTDIHYAYINSSDGNYIEFPLFYYSGYHAFDGNGNELPIRMSQRNRICVDLVNSPKQQTIDIVFAVDPVFKLSVLFSCIALLGLIIYIVFDIGYSDNRKKDGTGKENV